MKRVMFMILLVTTISSFGAIEPIVATNTTLNPSIEPTFPKVKLNKEDFIKLTTKDFEKYIGKKLTFKEKLAFKIVQKKVKTELRTGTNSNQGDQGRQAGTKQGKIALILGIAGLVAVFIPYVIIASIPLAILAIVIGNKAKKIDPSDKKARTGVVLGWVTLGLFVVILLIAAIVLTFPGWW